MVEKGVTMPQLYDYRLFISHAWKYGDSYDRLTNLLDNARYFSYYDYSAPQEKPLFPDGTPYTNADIATAITKKIRPAQITLVISGMYVAYRDWIQYEINESVRMGKPIIAIRPWGNSMMPTYVTNLADAIVGWNTNSIISAIKTLV